MSQKDLDGRIYRASSRHICREVCDKRVCFLKGDIGALLVGCSLVFTAFQNPLDLPWFSPLEVFYMVFQAHLFHELFLAKYDYPTPVFFFPFNWRTTFPDYIYVNLTKPLSIPRPRQTQGKRSNCYFYQYKYWDFSPTSCI